MRYKVKWIEARNRWLLEYHQQGKRYRLYFKTKAFAIVEGDRLVAETRESGVAWVSLSHTDRAEIMSVAREAHASGLTLRQVWEKFKTLKTSEAPNAPRSSGAVNQLR